MSKPAFAIEQECDTLHWPTRGSRVKRGVIHKICHFLFGKFDNSATIYKIKQTIHILKKKQPMKKEQINY